ncbi:MAG: hypothetical protein CMP24_01100 [Rickettsiales bacterium]|nr:hypothetical protein [Rickettsiales bacterium]
MNFFIYLLRLTLIFAAVFLYFQKAFADIKMSGYQEFFMGSADQTKMLGLNTSDQTDQSKSGFDNGTYTRIIATASTKLDNGLEVTGVYTLSKDTDSGGNADNDGVSVDQNDITVSGGFGTIAFGNTASTGSIMHYRADTIIPTAEPDGANYKFFFTAGSNSYGPVNELDYARDSMKIRYLTNVYEGFSAGISYASSVMGEGDTASGTDQNTGTASDYSDITDFVIKYAGETDGIGYGITYGYTTGNTQIVTSTQYNDYEGTMITGELSYAGFTIQAKKLDQGDSGGAVSTTDDGEAEGFTWCAKYGKANFSVGYCDQHSEEKETGVAIKNEMDVKVASIGYDLGGGVNVSAAYFSHEESQGNTTDTDVDGVFTMVSFGF